MCCSVKKAFMSVTWQVRREENAGELIHTVAAANRAARCATGCPIQMAVKKTRAHSFLYSAHLARGADVRRAAVNVNRFAFGKTARLLGTFLENMAINEGVGFGIAPLNWILFGG